MILHRVRQLYSTDEKHNKTIFVSSTFNTFDGGDDDDCNDCCCCSIENVDSEEEEGSCRQRFEGHSLGDISVEWDEEFDQVGGRQCDCWS